MILFRSRSSLPFWRWLLLSGIGCTALAAAPAKTVFDVRDYGAVGDGKHLDTAALNAAIDACSANGGGRVYLPPGHYLSGTIVLKSWVTFDLDVGATVLGSENPEDYVLPDAEGIRNGHSLGPLIYASDAEHITITGRGTIDGQGAIWWKRTRMKRVPSGRMAPEDQSERDRPYLVRPVRCTDVVIEQVTLRNSAAWTLNPVLCERVRVDGVTVFAEKNALNTDGINPDSCSNVQILNCRLETGDDCVTLKSGVNKYGRLRDRPCEDITIANCVMYRGHGGVVIGSEMSGGVRNVTITNCVFHGTDNGIRIKSQRGRGGVVEGVTVSNIVMQGVPTPFIITMFYVGKDKPDDVFPVDEGTPRFRDFLFSNITAREAQTAGVITGLKEMPIENITFSNVHVQAKTGLTCTNARDITFLDTVIDTETGPALVLDTVANIDSTRLHTRLVHAGVPLVQTIVSTPVAGSFLAKPDSSSLPEKSAPVAKTAATGASPDGLTKKTIPDLELTLVRIPAGKFMMGSPSSEVGRDHDETPRTEVTISHDFWLGEHEVTQHEWSELMGENPSSNKGDNLPVEQVSWFSAVDFCRKLTAREQAAGRLPEGYEYALPTEAQWEYACRAGTTGAYGGTGVYDEMGWDDSNSGRRTHPVGEKAPNAWGLYDMHGNVWEWCSDWMGRYPGGKVTDFRGAETGTLRIFRGGSVWAYDRGEGRSASRNCWGPEISASRLGFRLALSARSN